MSTRLSKPCPVGGVSGFLSVSAVAVAAGVLAACASTPSGLVAGADRSPAPQGVSSSSPTAVDPAGNKARADQEALRLLSLAKVPPGAVELTAAPSAWDGPVMGTSGTSSFIDHARYWRVSMSFTAVAAWLKAHPPTGLTSGGSESGSTHGVTDSVGYSYSGPDSDAWVEAQYEIGVVSDGPAASEIRADGVADWLDPVPQRDSASGNRLRVTIAGGCPTSDSGYHGVDNAGSDLDSAPLPDAQPTAGLICLYDGLNGNQFGLVATKSLDGAAAAKLATEVSKIPLSHLDDVVMHCPMDDGAAAVLVFSYPGRADVDLWYGRNGCTFVANGHISTATNDAFYGAVQSMLPALGSPFPQTS